MTYICIRVSANEGISSANKCLTCGMWERTPPDAMIAMAIRNVSRGDQLARESSGMVSPGSRRKEELVVGTSDSEVDRKGLRS